MFRVTLVASGLYITSAVVVQIQPTRSICIWFRYSLCSSGRLPFGRGRFLGCGGFFLCCGIFFCGCDCDGCNLWGYVRYLYHLFLCDNGWFVSFCRCTFCNLSYQNLRFGFKFLVIRVRWCCLVFYCFNLCGGRWVGTGALQPH